ncbi:MAG TPA: hypothetical protein VF032_08810 [Thermoleophilaceae bacterium]
MTRALLTGLVSGLCAMAFAAPATAAVRHAYAFRVTSASMSEVVSFQGDGGPACERAGMCGYSGRITYAFDHGDGYAIFLTGGRRIAGAGDFFFAGLTSAMVQPPGGLPACTDKVLHGADRFEVEGTAARPRLVFHPAFDAPRYLTTYCAGPSDRDIAHVRALPQLVLSARTLRHTKVHLEMSSTRSFHTGPFVGTVQFSVNIRMRRARDVAGIRHLLL